MNIVEKIVAKVREIAAARPDTVYGTYPDGTGCLYTLGICSDGSCGCLFGQAIKEVDPKAYAMIADLEIVDLGGTGTIRDIIVGNKFDMFFDEDVDPDSDDSNLVAMLNWCERVQMLQDGNLMQNRPRKPWGEAIAEADKEFEIV